MYITYMGLLLGHNSSDTENRTRFEDMTFALFLIKTRKQNNLWKLHQIICHLSGRTSHYLCSFKNYNHLKSVTSFWIDKKSEFFSFPDLANLMFYSIISKQSKLQVCTTTHFQMRRRQTLAYVIKYVRILRKCILILNYVLAMALRHV